MSSKIQTVKISDIGSEIDGLVELVSRGETRVIVEKSGVPVAALVSPEDLDLIDEKKRERARQERFKILDEIGAAFEDVPIEELEREAEKAIAEVRAEMRAERAARAAAARG
jgi:prevent-host-death family protein